MAGKRATTPPPYREILALQRDAIYGDLYGWTMAQAFFTMGKYNQTATFHTFIRNNPFKGGYLVTAGQNIFHEWLDRKWKPSKRDMRALESMTVKDMDGEPHFLFTDDFLEMVEDEKLQLTIDSMPEGEIAFPHVPINRITGPLWQGLRVETPDLNIINSQSLFATLASRFVEVAEGAPVVDFGLRRAQCIGGLESTRAAYVGGTVGTSNNEAWSNYHIPPVGTFAHAFVMVYEDEVQAFTDYIGAMPYNGIFLVDTYSTIEGAKRAIEVCKKTGAKLKGIRLDSGNASTMAHLAKEVRKLLDEAGFKDSKILASNDLDEEKIAEMKKQGAPVDVWCVGTNLVTSSTQPALGAVYKLGAIFNGDLTQEEIDAVRTLVKQGRQPHFDPDFMRDMLKLSEQPEKSTIQGELDLLRMVFRDATTGCERFDGDIIVPNFMPDPLVLSARPCENAKYELGCNIRSVLQSDPTRSKLFKTGTHAYRPLQREFEIGARCEDMRKTVHQAKALAAHQLQTLDHSHRALKDPHPYGVGLEKGLHDRRLALIEHLRNAIP